MSLVDRRVRRSESRAVALDLLLEACRQRGELDSLVVADERGLLVGAAGSASVDPITLAAVVAAERPHPRIAVSGRVSAQSFATHGRRMFVAGVGGTSSGPLHDAVRGAQRILG